MLATPPANLNPSKRKACNTLIGFKAKQWFTADIAMHGHVWVARRYGYSVAVNKTVKGNRPDVMTVGVTQP
jgi:hypothetical protein